MTQGLPSFFPDDPNVAANLIDTELTHVIPFALGSHHTEQEEINLARTWSTLFSLFPDMKEAAGFEPDKINKYRNCMTMLFIFHASFRKFKFSLEPLSDDNVYSIKTYPGFPTAIEHLLAPLNPEDLRIVKLERHADFELTSRAILRVHSAIARILNASGMGEQIKKVLEDRETLECLAPDGSTDFGWLLAV